MAGLLASAGPAFAQDGAALPAVLAELDPTSALLLSLAIGGFAAGLAGAVLHGRGRSVRAAREAALRAEADEVRAELDDARALVLCEPHRLLLWRGAADDAPVAAGSMPAEFSVPEDVRACLDFGQWLDSGDSRHLASALTELRAAGTPFSIFVRTRSGARLSADGFAVAGKAALKFKPLHGDSLDFVEAREQTERLGLELGSLRAGLASAPQPAWLRDRNGKLLWVNGAYASAVGAETPGAAVAGGLELAGEGPRDRAVAATRTGQVSRQRLHVGQGAARQSFEVIESPAPVGSVGIATDVTEAEHLRDELDRLVASHGRMLDRLTTAVAIFDPDQRLKFFNSAYAALWGLDEAWLREEPKDGEILDHLRDQGRLEERADYRAWRKQQLDAYRGDTAVENSWHLPDGRSLRVVAEPHPFGGLTYFYEDVTERLALETRYNGLLSVQKETLDNLNEGVALFGSDGRLKLFNPAFAAIWRLDAARLGGEPHMDEVIALCRSLTGPEQHWDELRRSVAAMGEARQPARGRIRRPDGAVVDHASVPLPDGATLFTYGDVTDSWRIERALRERNEALLAADHLKTAFLSHVSYELRAPLTAILGFAEFLGMETMGPLNERQQEYVEHITKASQDLRDLINDVLDLATIDAGAMELDRGRIDLLGLAQTASERIRGDADKAGVSIDVDIEPDAGTLQGDEGRLVQVLCHLLSNAVGFSSEGDRVTVGVRRQAADTVVFVADRGRGIDPKIRDRIFERFETYTEGTGHRGTGLGLAIVKSLVELHGGRIEVDSEPGKGTVVSCIFPAAGELPPTSPAPGRGSSLTVSPALDQTPPPNASRH